MLANTLNAADLIRRLKQRDCRVKVCKLFVVLGDLLLKRDDAASDLGAFLCQCWDGKGVRALNIGG